MKVIVCGGRTFGNAVFLFRTMDGLHAELRFTEFMQGGAPGTDALAKRWAKTHPEIVRWECKADWNNLSYPDAVIKTRPDGSQYDAMAGHRRNGRMLEWRPDRLVSFRGGPGTADMVSQARAANVKVIEVT